ncbi:hypothetical protein DPMN_192119 [Dreissena polymorpha]|uniref:Uncharacterized protein n=1 Tax=Dreissena polymorpha TaxID=45954 RepID=A0A9D4BCL7_DREPO|nr:hypothetical protein DPMN_192119 [Dreissena polymorpha]
MCTYQHKMHWSVEAILVNLVAFILYTTAVASRHWATKADASFSTHAGLFTACPTINDTCFDIHYHFNGDAYGNETKYIIKSLPHIFLLQKCSHDH